MNPVGLHLPSTMNGSVVVELDLAIANRAELLAGAKDDRSKDFIPKFFQNFTIATNTPHQLKIYRRVCRYYLLCRICTVAICYKSSKMVGM